MPPPPGSTPPVSRMVLGGGIVAAVAGASAALSLPALCPFRICTGNACPGCGLSRSVFSLLKGDVVESWRYHPLLVPLAAQVILIAVLRRRGPAPSWLNGLLLVNLFVVVGVWLVRWRLGLLDFVIAEGLK